MASDRRRMQELGKLGGLATAARRQAARQPREPLPWSLLELADRAGFTGESWARWRVWLKASEGMPLTPEELEVWRHHTGREHQEAGASRDCRHLPHRTHPRWSATRFHRHRKCQARRSRPVRCGHRGRGWFSRRGPEASSRRR